MQHQLDCPFCPLPNASPPMKLGQGVSGTDSPIGLVFTDTEIGTDLCIKMHQHQMALLPELVVPKEHVAMTYWRGLI